MILICVPMVAAVAEKKEDVDKGKIVETDDQQENGCKVCVHDKRGNKAE